MKIPLVLKIIYTRSSPFISTNPLLFQIIRIPVLSIGVTGGPGTRLLRTLRTVLTTTSMWLPHIGRYIVSHATIRTLSGYRRDSGI